MERVLPESRLLQGRQVAHLVSPDIRQLVLDFASYVPLALLKRREPLVLVSVTVFSFFVCCFNTYHTLTNFTFFCSLVRSLCYW